MRQLLICCFLTLVLPPVAFAQVDFKAQISKRQLGINERLRVEFSTAVSYTHLTLPTILLV